MPNRIRNPLVRQGHRSRAAPLAGSAVRPRDWLRRTAEAKHLDETGFRIAGRMQGLPGLRPPAWPFSRTHPRHGHARKGWRGTLAQDHWKPYCTVPDGRRQLCKAYR